MFTRGFLHGKTKFSMQIILLKNMNYTFKQIEDNLMRYCYDLLWLKFIYETTAARIRAQD